jgi:phospholipase C
VRQQVSHELFDHTSLINTILTRFAPDPEQAIANMGPRVAHAKHLGVLLGDEPRADLPATATVRQQIDAWHAEAQAARRPDQGKSRALDGAGRPFTLHDFQEDFARFALAVRRAGLPGGEP